MISVHARVQKRARKKHEQKLVRALLLSAIVYVIRTLGSFGHNLLTLQEKTLLSELVYDIRTHAGPETILN